MVKDVLAAGGGVGRVKFNIVANFASSAWSALATLVFTPVYLAYLGVEAYGLVGTYVLLQALLQLLDGGLGPALNRSMSQFTAGVVGTQRIRDLLRSIELVVAALAALITAVMALMADWLRVHWLNAQALPASTVTAALMLIGLVLATRLVENVYRSGLLGLQQQVALSFVTIVSTTLRTVGAAAVVAFVSPTIEAFFIWQAAIALLTALAMRTLLYSYIPVGERRARFAREALADVSHYAGGIVAVTVVSMMVSHFDKILLLKLRPLAEYGQYSLTVMAAGVILVPVGPVIQALLPRLTELVSRGEDAKIITLYHDASRALTALIASMAWAIMAFAEPLMRVWLHGAATATTIAPLLTIYIAGTFFSAINGLIWIVQLAYGRTGLALRVNCVALVLVLAALLWSVPRYGVAGACWVWVALNVAMFVVIPSVMHRSILRGESTTFYLGDVCLPVTVAGVVVFAIRMIQPPLGDIATVVYAVVAGSLALAASLSTVPTARRLAVSLACRLKTAAVGAR